MATEYKLPYTGQEISNKLGKVDEAVRYTSQTLTDAQKSQVRENIGAMGEEAIKNLVVTAIVNAGELINISDTFETIYEAYNAGRNISLHIQTPSGSTTMLPCTSIDADNAFFDAVTAIAGQNTIHSAIIFSDDTSNYTSSLIDGGMDEETLNSAVESALTEAKESGEFDGADGKDGTSVTVSKVTESSASGGTNVVTFSDGTTLNVKNGKDGADGEDYVLTAADKNEIADSIATGLTLGVHTDGLIYIFKNGEPIGNGIEMGVSGDVEPTYTNLIPKSTVSPSSTTIYNGKGYKENTRWSSSSAAESSATGVYVTGCIPWTAGGVVRLKNIRMNKNDTASNVRHICLYTGSAWSSQDIAAASDFNPVWDADGNLTQFTLPNWSNTHFRLNTGYIGDDSILTIDEPIE